MQPYIDGIDFTLQGEFAMTLADGFIVMYSVTSTESMRSARRLVREIREKSLNRAPIVLLGNKKDLEHHREVSRAKATQMARKLRCNLFCELSVATEISSVRNVFSELYKRIQKKSRTQALVERSPRKSSAMYLMMRAINSFKSNIISSSPKCSSRNQFEKAMRIDHVKELTRMPVL